MKCFLDLDGVIVDFIGGVCKAHNVPNPWLKKEYKGLWGAEEMFGIDKSKFWGIMDEDFWANLEWTKEGKDILALVEDCFGKENVIILTTPCDTEGGVNGKVKWIKKNLPDYSKQFLIGFKKHFCANKNVVLVDDCDKNIIDFRREGGFGVLVPRPWNTLYKLEGKLLDELNVHFTDILI